MNRTGQPGDGRTAERARLEAGLEMLGLAVDERIVSRLLAHAELVRQWTGTYNLVARGDLDGLVGRHVLDSLAIHHWIPPGRLLDVGSGAGFPGLPLALALPRLEVALLDSSGKRARFLRHVVRALRLDNVSVVQCRVEDYQPGQPFSSIVSRAFGTLAGFAVAVRHLATADTRLLACKGRRPAHELGALPAWVTVQSVQRYHVPDLHAERHVVIMTISPQAA